MPRPPKKSTKPKTTKPRSKRTKRSGNVPDYAGLSVKRSISDNGNNFNTNRLYSLMDVQLIDYPRAVQVAQAYQHYRIKRVTLTIKPTYDTYSQGFSKMHCYYMIDKSGSIPTNVSLEGLKQMGARPISLDEQPLKISYVPTVLESTMYAPGAGNTAASKYQSSPWLTTRAGAVGPGAFVASGIDHLGVYWWVEQLVSTGVTGYQCEVEIQFQFKKPLANDLTTSVAAIPATVSVINDSPDGIVGGVDGV